jgi:hypothetical protein
MDILTEQEKPILAALAELTRPTGEFCVPSYRISGAPSKSPETREVRQIIRQLVRKGMAEFHRGLFDYDEGMLCGSGYCITNDGLAALVPEAIPEKSP